MKRLFALALALILIAMGMVSCNKTPEETEPTENTFTLGELTITLPDGFRTTSPMSNTNQAYIISENYSVTIFRVSHSSITPNEGYDFPTLEEFFVNSGMLKGIKSAEDIEIVDDMKIFNENYIGDEEPDVCILLAETDGAFWTVKVESWTDDYTTVKATALEWFNTIVFSKAE